MNTTGDHTIKRMKILPCVCSHEWQDKRYGKGQRAHNPVKNGYRCTVCGRVDTETK